MSFLSRIIDGFLNPPIDEDAAVEEILYIGEDIPKKLSEEFPDISRSDIKVIWKRSIILLVKTYREEAYDGSPD